MIDATLSEFDKQAAMRQQGISDQAVALGGYGGGREGVMQSEYQLGSDRNRALLEAQMQQQGYGEKVEKTTVDRFLMERVDGFAEGRDVLNDYLNLLGGLYDATSLLNQ